MQDVSIIGVGQIPVGEHWQSGLRELGAEALRVALEDAGQPSVDALYVGNAYGGTINSQTQLGPLIADYSGLHGTEAYTVEAGDASGGAALRTAYMAVRSGAVRTALALGVEKMTDSVAGARVAARSVSLDADLESIHGTTLPALAAMLMQRYMHEYSLDLTVFEGFSVNAHANGSANPNAMFRNTLRPGAFGKAPMISSPVSLFDGAPDADGAAAVVLTAGDTAEDMVPQPVKVVASAVATDTLTLQERDDPLRLGAVAASAQRALEQANVKRDNLSLAELHDAFTILTALSLEAMGFAPRGEGWRFASDTGAKIGLHGQLPLSTFGGLKSRGNPAGATGVYQAVEAALQLRAEADENQVSGAKVALIQNLGGLASTAISHILAV